MVRKKVNLASFLLGFTIDRCYHVNIYIYTHNLIAYKFQYFIRSKDFSNLV
jgi:hypothetical protein